MESDLTCDRVGGLVVSEAFIKKLAMWIFYRGGGYGGAIRTERAERVCYFNRFPEDSTFLKVEGFLGSSLTLLSKFSISLSNIGLYSSELCFLRNSLVWTAFSTVRGIFLSSILSNAFILKGTTLNTGLYSFTDIFSRRFNNLNRRGP